MRSVVAIGLALLLTGCGSPPATPSTMTPPVTSGVSVVGRVIDVPTNAGVGGMALEWRPIVGGSVTDVVARTVSDSSGAYFAILPSAGKYVVGSGTVQVVGPLFTSDFFVHSPCPLRYGVVTDAATGRPVSGATVTWSLGHTLSRTDGTYSLDLGCRSDYGNGTTAVGVTHPAYLDNGVFDTRAEFLVLGGERRVDFMLMPR